MTDCFYTPQELCKKVIGAATSKCPKTVGDFSAGSGELLKAAHLKWPNAEIVATDIDPVAVQQLRAAQPNWTVGKCNFLSARSRQNCKAIRNLLHHVSVILLNPPFSCRGGERWTAALAGHKVQCSRATAFLMSALEYMGPGGELVAIMPAGSLCSRKDRSAWDLMRMVFAVEIVGTNGHRTFNGCFPRTVILRLVPKVRFLEPCPATCKRSDHAVKGVVKLHRGKLPMHSLPQRKPKYPISVVHSTDLRDHKLSIGPQWAKNDGGAEIISGPVLLLPRVGEPCKSKVVLYRGRERFVLSDCVFGLKSRISMLEQVQEFIVQRWRNLEKLYRGTGAKYLTAADLAGALRWFGFQVEAANGHPKAHQLVRAVSNSSELSLSQEDVANLRSLLLSLALEKR